MVGEFLGRRGRNQVIEDDPVEVSEFEQLENVASSVARFDARDLILPVLQSARSFGLCESGGFPGTNKAKPKREVELGVPGSRHVG